MRLKEENPESYYNFKSEIGRYFFATFSLIYYIIFFVPFPVLYFAPYYFRGKFAVVKKCASKITGETYAAKMVKYDEDTIDVTKKEFEIWCNINHANLVVLYDAYLVRKYLILICELVQGEPILQYLAALPKLTEDDVVNCICQLLEALEYLHSIDICHLDVKVRRFLRWCINQTKDTFSDASLFP